MVKRMHSVPIPAKLYPQRFQLKNRGEVELNRSKIDQLNDQVKQV